MDSKKDGGVVKMEKSSTTKNGEEKSKANIVISNELEEHDSAIFMAHREEHQRDESWYMDRGAIEHMTDHLDWFALLEEIPSGCWPIMIGDNWKLWVWGIGHINVQCLVNGYWHDKKL